MTSNSPLALPTIPWLPAALAAIFFFAILMGPGPAQAARPEPSQPAAKEKNPYLPGRAASPVHWLPWAEATFVRARSENKPIFLSIGDRASHLCGAMEKESFSDRKVAALLNQAFLAVKVDHKERPDIDQLYMTACRQLSSSCDWPLTIFMTPEKQPFFITSYRPREDRPGKPGLLTLLGQIKKQWREDRAGLLQTARRITDNLIKTTERVPGLEPPVDRADLDSAFNKLASDFDAQHGGFGNASKYPQPQHLMFLLRYWHRTGEPLALAMVEKTLTAMRLGAIYDQLGHGFHRYTSDRAWRTPHFEKMLYDQALLTIVYLEAYQATRKPEYAAVVREVIDYVFRQLTSRDGVFFSAEGADSRDGKGGFYLWREKELRLVLGKKDAETVRRVFNTDTAGNFPDPVRGEKNGANVLFRNEKVALPTDFKTIRAKLLAARTSRPRPAIDDTVLADWNGMMIAALASAALILNEPAYGDTAARAADFILNKMVDTSGRLQHRWRAGEAGLRATAADYAYLIWGLTELYEWSFEPRWLEAGLKLNHVLIEHFWDKQQGGCFLTPDDGEALLIRAKPVHDQGLPSANSMTLFNLLRLSRLTSRPGFEEKAAELMKAFAGEVEKDPAGHAMFLAAASLTLWPSHEVVIVGSRGSDDTQAMLKALRERYLPDALVQFRPSEQTKPPVVQSAPFMEFMAAVSGKATVYVCTDFNCKLPTTDIDRMLHLLQPPAAGR